MWRSAMRSTIMWCAWACARRACSASYAPPRRSCRWPECRSAPTRRLSSNSWSGSCGRAAAWRSAPLPATPRCPWRSRCRRAGASCAATLARSGPRSPARSVAGALPPGGGIVGCDVREEWTALARRYWKQARVEKKIALHVAPALETLARLKGRFDLAFIDADKPNYAKYYEHCLRLVRKGGLIAVDNTLWSGAVIDPAQQSENTRALRTFNQKISKDKRVDIALLAIGDGLTLAVKR